MTIENALKRGTKQLEAAGIPSARLDTLLLLELAAKRDKSWLLAHPERKLSQDEATAFKRLLTDRAKRRPMAYIRGKAEFYGLNLEVNDDVLSPRAETETIVELAVALAPQNSRLIDVGTGSGAIAVAVAKQRADIEVTAVDISEAALEIARRNALKHSVDINFSISHLLAGTDGTFDVIAANLPYLTPDKLTQPETLFEPKEAFVGGGTDGLGLYREFFSQVPDHLAREGLVLIEAEPWQHPELISLAQAPGLKPHHQEGLVLAFKSNDA